MKFFSVSVVLVCVAVSYVHSASIVVSDTDLDTSNGVDLCSRPSPDPCSPGGKWDSLLNG